MIEKQADLWVEGRDADAIVVTTNGFVTNSGNAVMGRGCAKEAAARIPMLAFDLGQRLQNLGNHVFMFSYPTPCPPTVHSEAKEIIVTFPVKIREIIVPVADEGAVVVRHMVGRIPPRDGCIRVPGWATKANINIMYHSWYELKVLATALAWRKIVLPRPGCGAGELTWQEVKDKVFHDADNRFIFVHK